MVIKNYCELFDPEGETEDFFSLEQSLVESAKDIGIIKNEKEIIDEQNLIEYLNLAALWKGYEGCAFCKLEIKKYEPDPDNPTIIVYGVLDQIMELEDELEGAAEVTQFEFKGDEFGKIEFAWYDVLWHLRYIILKSIRNVHECMEEDFDEIPYKSTQRNQWEERQFKQAVAMDDKFMKRIGWKQIVKNAAKERAVMKDDIWIKVNGHNNLIRFYFTFQDLILDVVQYGRKNSGRYKVKMVKEW